MKLLRKYKVVDKSPSKRTVADLGKNAGRAELKRLVDNAVNLKRIAKATGNPSFSRFVDDLPLKCGELDVMDIRVVEAKAKAITSILDVLDKTARNGDVFEDAASAQLERNYNAAFSAVKSSLVDYLKARKASFKGDDVMKKEKLTRVRRAFDDLVWGHKTIHNMEEIIFALPKPKKDKALAAFNAFQQSGSKVVDILMEIENELN